MDFSTFQTACKFVVFDREYGSLTIEQFCIRPDNYVLCKNGFKKCSKEDCPYFGNAGLTTDNT